MKSNVSQFKASNLGVFVDGDIHAGKLPNRLDALIAKVKPMFVEWLRADKTWERNTSVVATAVHKAWVAFGKDGGASRVEFARLFDESIAEGTKTRELASNATYNRLNYLIDKVGKPRTQDEDAETERVTLAEKRTKMKNDFVSFKRRFAHKAIAIADVETLIAKMLGVIWTDEAIGEVVTVKAKEKSAVA